jgi:hypothetical protein
VEILRGAQSEQHHITANARLPRQRDATIGSGECNQQKQCRADRKTDAGQYELRVNIHRYTTDSMEFIRISCRRLVNSLGVAKALTIDRKDHVFVFNVAGRSFFISRDNTLRSQALAFWFSVCR